MTNQPISTDLLYDYLADPNKLKPIKQTAKIINNDNDSDNHESYIVDINNNINNETPKINFNSDNINNLNMSNSSNKKSSSQKRILSFDNKLSLSPKYKLKEQINNLNQKFSTESYQKPPIVKSIENSPIAKNSPKVKNIQNDIAAQKELKFKKMEIFAKLMHIKNTGIELTRKYTIDSEINDMEAELKYHSDIQSKKNGVQLAKSFMCNAITGLEYMNDQYDPFGIKLKGWSDQVKMNKDDFDEVFEELLEKYKGNGKKLEPELKLAMMLIISAGSFHMTQSMTANLPGLDDVIKNNPELMAKLQSNINKSISGPSELDKKKELYENVKKLHDDKIKQNTTKPQNSTSVKNLLNDIKKSFPITSTTNNESITIGNTINSDSETTASISENIKTKTKNKIKSINKKNIQFTNT